MNNVVIDRYTLELEALSEHENSPTPVRCIATNTDDKTTADAWLTLEKARALFSFAYGNEQTIVDWCMQQLEGNHYVDMIAPQPEGAKTDRKSTRLNSSHLGISYAVFCLKKKQ